MRGQAPSSQGMTWVHAREGETESKDGVCGGCGGSAAFRMAFGAAVTAQSTEELVVSCLTFPLPSLILTVSFTPSGHPCSWSTPLPWAVLSAHHRPWPPPGPGQLLISPWVSHLAQPCCG